MTPPRFIIVFSGHRHFAPGGERVVEATVASIIDRLRSRSVPCAVEMRFGGALGVDTIALRVAFERRALLPLPTPLRLVVFAPGTRAELPVAAREAARRYADEVVELGRDLSRATSFHERNTDMLVQGYAAGEDGRVLYAFHDGRSGGGTSMAMAAAEQLGIEVLAFRLPGGVSDGPLAPVRGHAMATGPEGA